MMTTPGTDTAADARYAGAGLWEQLRRHPAGNVLIVFSLFLLACVIVGLSIPDDFRFLSTPNLRVLMRAIAPIGIMALGAGILMIAGEFDLSISATFTLAPYMMVLTWGAGVPEAIAIWAALGTAVLIGLANGAITLGFGIPSFITTLGTLFMIRSGSRVIGDMRPLSFLAGSDKFIDTFTGKIGIVPVQFLWFLAFAVLAHLLMTRHRLGNHFFAVGGNREAAAATNNASPARSGVAKSARTPIRPANKRTKATTAKFPTLGSCMIARRRARLVPPRASAKSPRPSSCSPPVMATSVATHKVAASQGLAPDHTARA